MPPKGSKGRRFTRAHCSDAVWGSPPGGTRDQGQRYRVTYCDGPGTRRVYGFTEALDEARDWVRKVEAHPVFHSPKLRDRHAVRAGVARIVRLMPIDAQG